MTPQNTRLREKSGQMSRLPILNGPLKKNVAFSHAFSDAR